MLQVKTYKMHMYTVLQLVCLAVLWVVKSTQAALAFPFFLILMVPLRQKLMTRAFTAKELSHVGGLFCLNVLGLREWL